MVWFLSLTRNLIRAAYSKIDDGGSEESVTQAILKDSGWDSPPCFFRCFQSFFMRRVQSAVSRAFQAKTLFRIRERYLQGKAVDIVQLPNPPKAESIQEIFKAAVLKEKSDDAYQLCLTWENAIKRFPHLENSVKWMQEIFGHLTDHDLKDINLDRSDEMKKKMFFLASNLHAHDFQIDLLTQNPQPFTPIQNHILQNRYELQEQWAPLFWSMIEKIVQNPPLPEKTLSKEIHDETKKKTTIHLDNLGDVEVTKQFKKDISRYKKIVLQEEKNVKEYLGSDPNARTPLYQHLKKMATIQGKLDPDLHFTLQETVTQTPQNYTTQRWLSQAIGQTFLNQRVLPNYISIAPNNELITVKKSNDQEFIAEYEYSITFKNNFLHIHESNDPIKSILHRCKVEFKIRKEDKEWIIENPTWTHLKPDVPNAQEIPGSGIDEQVQFPKASIPGFGIDEILLPPSEVENTL